MKTFRTFCIQSISALALCLTSAAYSQTFIESYFNRNPRHKFQEPYRPIVRAGDDFEAVLLREVSAARPGGSILIAVQELRLPRLTQLLINKKKEGVIVNVIIENTYNWPIADLHPDPNNTSDRDNRHKLDYFNFVDLNHDGKLSPTELSQRDAIYMIRKNGIPLIDDTEDGSIGTALMHNKFVVINGQTVVVSSANFTLSDMYGDFMRPHTRGNANSLVVVHDSRVAQIFTREFAQMWGDGPGGTRNSLFGIRKNTLPPQTVSLNDGTRLTIKFSPTSPALPYDVSTGALIARVLITARSYIDAALFVFSDQNIANTMENVYTKHKVQASPFQLRVLVEPQFAYRPYSELLDIFGLQLKGGPKCTYETNNNPWKSPIRNSVGIPTLIEGDMLHHKFGVMDGHVVIMGSHNWSQSANNANDETLMVIENPAFAKAYQAEFERLFSQSRLGVPAWVQKAADSGECVPTEKIISAYQ